MSSIWDSAQWIFNATLHFAPHAISPLICVSLTLVMTFLGAKYLTSRFPLPIAAISDAAPTNRARRVAVSEYYEKTFFILWPTALSTYILGVVGSWLLIESVHNLNLPSASYPWIGLCAPISVTFFGQVAIEMWIGTRRLIWGPTLCEVAAELEDNYPEHCASGPDGLEMERAAEEKDAKERAVVAAEESRIWAKLCRYRWVDVQRAEERFQQVLDEKVAYYETRHILPEKAEKGLI